MFRWRFVFRLFFYILQKADYIFSLALYCRCNYVIIILNYGTG